MGSLDFQYIFGLIWYPQFRSKTIAHVIYEDVYHMDCANNGLCNEIFYAGARATLNTEINSAA